MMLKASIPNEAGNAAIKEGSISKKMQSMLADLKPEAAYFTDFDGKRTAYIFFEMNDPSEIPAVAEPWFLAFTAHVEFHPVMVPEDLAKAAPSIDQASKKYSPAA